MSRFTGIFMGSMAILGTSVTSAAELVSGDMPPAFELMDQNGKSHRLSDYSGQWVVLYFYPKDDTPGCTKEACNFRDDIFKLKDLGAHVLGISLDSVESHTKFAKKHGLPFPLLSDENGKTARAYGTFSRFLFVNYAKRHTFIVDPAGLVAKIYREVDPDTHSTQVINDLQVMQKQAS